VVCSVLVRRGSGHRCTWEDFALGLVLEETDAEDTFWLEPHLVEFVDHGGTQQFTLGHGPDAISTWRDEDGNWHDGIALTER
jgi:hypothetical protein